MNSILNVEVSCFKNYRTSHNPKTVTLLQWLTSAKYSPLVQQIRKLPEKAQRDQLKATLPAITPSGLFSQRKTNALIQHSGFIQFDIDFKENQHINNYQELKEQISNLENVAYCGLSVSGTGYWGLIPIAHPHKHKDHFEALKMDFQSFGIVLDDKPKSVVSLRGYSFDDKAYFNHLALTYTKTYNNNKSARVTIIKPYKIKPSKRSNKEKVESLIQEICLQRIDLTKDYNDWFVIGSSIASEFGESGRIYFHQISQFHPEYNSKQTDRQYDGCLKTHRFSIGSFYRICQDIGPLVIPSNNWQQSNKQLNVETLILKDGTKISNIINEYGYPKAWDNLSYKHITPNPPL